MAPLSNCYNLNPNLLRKSPLNKSKLMRPPLSRNQVEEEKDDEELDASYFFHSNFSQNPKLTSRKMKLNAPGIINSNHYEEYQKQINEEQKLKRRSSMKFIQNHQFGKDSFLVNGNTFWSPINVREEQVVQNNQIITINSLKRIQLQEGDPDKCERPGCTNPKFIDPLGRKIPFCGKLCTELSMTISNL